MPSRPSGSHDTAVPMSLKSVSFRSRPVTGETVLTGTPRETPHLGRSDPLQVDAPLTFRLSTPLESDLLAIRREGRITFKARQRRQLNQSRRWRRRSRQV